MFREHYANRVRCPIERVAEIMKWLGGVPASTAGMCGSPGWALGSDKGAVTGRLPACSRRTDSHYSATHARVFHIKMD